MQSTETNDKGNGSTPRYGKEVMSWTKEALEGDPARAFTVLLYLSNLKESLEESKK